MSIWKWSDWMAPVPEAARITLGEGTTPLVLSRKLGRSVGLERLYFKLEYLNPTGSYKDRFAAVAVSDMLAQGKKRCVATSSGNTGAALAGYCAAAGIRLDIAIVETAPLEKCKQMLAYGARLFRIRGYGLRPDMAGQVLGLLSDKGQEPECSFQISAYKYCPVGMSGVQSVSYDLAEQLSEPIDHVFSPGGGCGAAYAVAYGFRQLVEQHRVARGPKVHVVQPEGNDTIASAMRRGETTGREVTCTSKISGLQVPTLIDGPIALSECLASGGTGHTVTDDEVWAAQSRLAREEGIFCEPAGAAATAAVLRAARANLLKADDVVVALVTGSGFKDAPSIDRMVGENPCPIVEVNEFARQL